MYHQRSGFYWFLLFLLISENVAPKVLQLNARNFYAAEKKHSQHACPPELLTVFRRYRNLQRLCQQKPALVATVVTGLRQATRECQYQMRENRWDCTQDHPSLSVDFTVLHEPPILKYGFRETAFLVALSSAGVVCGVARACTSGLLNSCRCNAHQHASDQAWEWGGCSYSTKYGFKTARRILFDKLTKNGDDTLMHSVHKHNIKAGIQAVKRTITKTCKCHGVSGSCELKTCWKSPADMRLIGDRLKNRYDRAAFLSLHTNSPNDSRVQNARAADLVYFQKSPTFCRSSYDLRTPGVTGRVCRVSNATHSVGDCQKICCENGHFAYREAVDENCNCRVRGCCEVVCDKCTSIRTISKCR